MQLDDPEQANGVTLRQMIGARAPWFAKEFGPVHWTTSVTFQPGYTRHFGQGRVWLVGDAAHSTSPLGVQSMNIGFREAHGLVRRLSRILHHEGPDKLLEYYDDDRAREWRMMLGIKDRLAIRESAPAWARKFGFRLLRSLPASGNDLNRLLDQVGLRLSWLRGKNRGR
jgi:2-polyprenyl-6-methoxyphenol hydroxylase-like FAD-dependent oxidoreductase